MLDRIGQNPPECVEDLRTKLSEEVKAAIGAGSELLKLKKCVATLKSMLSKRSAGSSCHGVRGLDG